MTITGWISLLALWCLFFWFYREYRMDAFRQHLFVLRDELFDLARAGRIPFRSKAYGVLRSTINGNIQFGHRCGFLEVLCFVVVARKDLSRDSEALIRYDAMWRQALGELDPDAQKKLESIRTRMHMRVVEQIIFTSATLVFSFIAVVCWILFHQLRHTVAKAANRFFVEPSVRRIFDLYDCAATLKAS